MSRSWIVCSVLLILFGIFSIIYGEIDDSPGGQLLGLLAIILGIAVATKSKKKN